MKILFMQDMNFYTILKTEDSNAVCEIIIYLEVSSVIKTFICVCSPIINMSTYLKMKRYFLHKKIKSNYY